MTKPAFLTTPEIDPETGHEKNLPDPRPRYEIWQEMLASWQVNPATNLYDIYYRLQSLMLDFSALVEKEMEAEKATKRKAKKTKHK